ncbi:hypothetical protein SY2F82_35070 [Streptomyces sp. Y2F8-2]|nr:hypothetical protein SY2F82_35070 [Streptomyces sp. Y2F8-2]
MASQLFKKAFGANQPTCHYLKISHPSTVVLAGLRGEALTGMRSLTALICGRGWAAEPKWDLGLALSDQRDDGRRSSGVTAARRRRRAVREMSIPFVANSVAKDTSAAERPGSGPTSRPSRPSRRYVVS